MRRWYPALFLAVATILAFWKVLLHREFTLLAGGDTAHAYFPWFDVAAYWLKKGVWLLWDPYVYAGKVNMGEPQPGLFYPLNWIVFLLPARGGGVSLDGLQGLMILNHFLAACFFYFLARSFQQSRVASTAAAIAYSFGGFTVQLYGYINILSGFVWLPAALLFFRKACGEEVTRGRIRWILCSGLCLALSFLPGHHIPPVHIGILLFFYGLFEILERRHNRTLKAAAAVVAGLAGIAAVAALITALQWIPSLEWAQKVYRWVGDGPPVTWGQKVPYSALEKAGNLQPQDALSLVFPYLSTNSNLYTGCVVLFLAMIGALFARRREARFFCFASFLYLFLSWGRFSSLHGWVNSFIPGAWFAREVFHYLVPFQACLALLAGWGLDALAEAFAGRSDPELDRFLRSARSIIIGVILVAGGLTVILLVSQGLSIAHPYVRGCAAMAVYLAALGFLLFLAQSKRIRSSTFQYFMVGIILVDLSSALSTDIPLQNPPSGQENYYVRAVWKTPPEAKYLQSLRAGGEKYFRVDDSAGVFPPNYGDVWRLDASMGHGATALVDYFKFRGTGWEPGSNASSLLNIRYFLSRAPVFGMEPLTAVSPLLYRNPRASPRAFLTDRYRTFSNDDALLAWVSSPLYTPREVVLLRQEDFNSLPPEFQRELAQDAPGLEARLEKKERGKNGLHQGEASAAPWGWVAGDSLEVTLRSAEGARDVTATMHYFPTKDEVSTIALEDKAPTGDRSVLIVLPGLAAGEAPRSKLKNVRVNLGLLGQEPHRFLIKKPVACSALIDSIHFDSDPRSPEPDLEDRVSISSHKPNRLRIQAKAARTSVLVLSEVYFPGWEAWVDGVRTPLIRGDYILRAIPIRPGAHEIEIRFNPQSFRWGLAISLVSIVLVGYLLFWLKPRNNSGTFQNGT